MWPLRMQGLFFMEIFVMDGVDCVNIWVNRANLDFRQESGH